jgi:hypothetical protein
MGRRRKFHRITLTSLAISEETLDTINRLKPRKETQDDFVRRVLVEWQSSKEVIKDLELAENYKDRRIEQYESELEKLRTMVEYNPAMQELK